jgi:hypothetical protein
MNSGLLIVCEHVAGLLQLILPTSANRLQEKHACSSGYQIRTARACHDAIGSGRVKQS